MSPLDSVSSMPSTRAVDADLPCCNCQYNLRTLSPAALCPECAMPVAQSIARYRPVLRDPRRAAWGALILALYYLQWPLLWGVEQLLHRLYGMGPYPPWINLPFALWFQTQPFLFIAGLLIFDFAIGKRLFWAGHGNKPTFLGVLALVSAGLTALRVAGFLLSQFWGSPTFPPASHWFNGLQISNLGLLVLLDLVLLVALWFDLHRLLTGLNRLPLKIAAGLLYGILLIDNVLGALWLIVDFLPKPTPWDGLFQAFPRFSVYYSLPLYLLLFGFWCFTSHAIRRQQPRN